MALIVMTSAAGSPGVSTSALALAMAWPRPTVLIDADPSGAQAFAAGYFRGGELPTDATIVDLAIAHRQGTLAEDLPEMLISIPDTQVQLLCGPRQHNQTHGLGSLWEPLAGVLKSLGRNGQDVIVDIGRLGLEGSAFKLLTAADLLLLVTRSTLPDLVAASSWASTLRDTFTNTGAIAGLGALLVGPGNPYSTAETAKVLQMPVVTSLAWDPAAAKVYSQGASYQPLPRRVLGRGVQRVLRRPDVTFEAAPLNKSLRAAVRAVQATLTTAREDLDLGLEGRSYP